MAAHVLCLALFLLQLLVLLVGSSGENVVGTRWAVLIAGSNGYENYRHTGEDFLAVLLGDNSTLTGSGSGKVVNSGPDDHIFVYYTDHGGAGVLGMPSGESLYAKDLVQTLEKKHAAGGAYKSLVFYVEACESGSIFEGLLPADINVYATTASGAAEDSLAAYCPGGEVGPSPPPGFDTCLGDLYSVAWMEDSDNNQSLYSFIGTNPANDNATSIDQLSFVSGGRVNQRVADLVYFWHKYRNSGDDAERTEARERLLQVVARRSQVDNSVELIGSLLFGSDDQGSKVLNAIRPAGQPLVDDWDCLKSFVRTYEGHCGPLGQYGIKHMRAFANICNAGITAEDMALVAAHSETQY
ncbi:hypothetical protein EJB05_57888, partial [Eragrostis curvula]